MNKLLVVLVLLAVCGCATRPDVARGPEALSEGQSLTHKGSNVVGPAVFKPWASPSPAEEDDPPPGSGGGESWWTMQLGSFFVNAGANSYTRATVNINGPYNIRKDTLAVVLRWESVRGGVLNGIQYSPVWSFMPGSLWADVGSPYLGMEFLGWSDTDTSGYLGTVIQPPLNHPYTVPTGNGAWFAFNFPFQTYGDPGTALVKLKLVTGSWLLNIAGGPNPGWQWRFSPKVSSGTGGTTLPTWFPPIDSMYFTPRADYTY